VTVTRLAVIGPTGAGKSRLCRLLADLGAEVVEADQVGHEVLAQPAVRARIAAEFGAGVSGSDGTVDRTALGAIVFADPGRRAALDAITHPPLAAALADRLAKADEKAPLVILEAAVYFLLPGPPPVDAVVAVVASAPLRQRRLEAQGLTAAQAAARIAAQAHLEPTWARADRIIANDGDEAALAAAARDLYRAYSPGGKS
jgi:dephospho-CoA kinase